jgi:myo-inositol-1(or 4)-monophosphatase
MSLRLQTALRAARAAGKVLLDKLHDGRQIHSKGKRDIVTDADYAADRTVRKILLSRFPRDQFLSEEDDADARKRLWAQASASDGLALWVVDPLDGTTNYSRSLCPFCVSIALYQAGAVRIGVVYDPIRDELFSAERGRGARLNGKPIRASSVRAFDAAVIGTEWARAPKLRRRMVAILAQVVGRAMTARAFGSAALSLCAIAAGRMDGYIHLSLSPWDVAAAALIVEEAGGTVTTPAGVAWNLHCKGYVASNGLLHSRLLRCFDEG